MNVANITPDGQGFENNTGRKKGKLSNQITLWIMMLALPALLVLGLVSYIQARGMLQNMSFNQLQSIQSIRHQQIESVFLAEEDNLASLAIVIGSLRDQAYNTLQAVTTSRSLALAQLFEGWSADVRTKSVDGEIVGFMALAANNEARGAVYQSTRTFLKVHSTLYGLEDIFLVDAAGTVVLSVYNQNILNTDLASGPYRDTNLAQLARQLETTPTGTAHFADVSRIDNQYVLLVGAPVYQGSTYLGALVYQLPLAGVNAIVQDRTGMGFSGESYLITRIGDEVVLRSDRIVEAGSIGDTEAVTVANAAALAGQIGTTMVLRADESKMEAAAYMPLHLSDLPWSIVTTIALDEVISPTAVGSDQDMLAGYAEQYGYHDVLLITPEGYVFYTVAHEADYQTNLVDGPYKDTNLARLVRQVIKTQQIGFTDAALYAPGDNEVAMFLAAPVIEDGALQMIIAVQPSREKINTVMQDRVGMGETGESYLVGPDYRMRSDSALNPDTHSVEASFTGSVEDNGVDTQASREALAGKSGAEIVEDYQGQQVLAAWSALDILGTRWAIIAEQRVSEVLAPANQLMWIVLGIGGLAIAAVLVVAFLIARRIANPVNRLSQVAIEMANGKLNQHVTIRSNNEIGVLADAFTQMAHSLQEMVQSEIDMRIEIEAAVAQYLTFVQCVAQGDLTQRLVVDIYPGQDQNDPLILLGNNLNDMVDGLADMAGQIQDVGYRLASSATEILAATTQQLSSSTEQDASITQTTATVDEVRRTVSQTAERADEVAQYARRSVEASERGMLAVTSSVEGMEMIGERVKGIAEDILALSEKTQQIGDIISSVNNIAEQSKMLALNASIEAARAGEEGRGFAVVAMEVRNLAEQSREATEQVRLILSEIQQATNAAVMATEEGSKGVDAGQERVAQAGQVIDELAQVIRDASQAATQIAASTRQQTTGMDQLGTAMDTIRQASTQSQASTQQAERAAQDLSSMATQMQRAISRYKLNNGNDREMS